MLKKVDFLEKNLRNFEGFWPFITRGDFLQVYRPKKFRLYAIPIWNDLSTVRQPKPNHFASFTKRNTKNHRFAPSKVDFLRFLVQKLHFLTFIYCRGTPMYTIWGVGALWALTLLWLICTSASVLASHSSQLGLSANLGLVWHMLSPCGPSGRQRGMGTLSVVSYSMSRVAWERTKVSSVWSHSDCVSRLESQRSALAGTGFEAQLLLSRVACVGPASQSQL